MSDLEELELAPMSIGEASQTISPAQQGWKPHPPEFRPIFEAENRLRKGTLRGFLAGAVVVGLAIAWCPPIGGIYLAYWLILLFAFVTVSKQNDSPNAADEMLMADSEWADDVLVNMWVEVNGVIRGADRGVTWFDKTGFYFYGHRSWFRVAQSDLATARKTGVFSIPPELDVLKNVTILELRNSGTRLRVGLREVRRYGEFPRSGSSQDRVAFQVKSFDVMWDPEPQPTYLPPTSFDPWFRKVGYPIPITRKTLSTILCLVALIPFLFLGGPFSLIGYFFGALLAFRTGRRLLIPVRANTVRLLARWRRLRTVQSICPGD